MTAPSRSSARSPRIALLALAVGLVLADSSVVTLGLPDVLEDFDATPPGVSWVLTGYNLTLALAAVPAALVLRRHSAERLAAGGLGVFAAASLACALAPSLGVLVVARGIQGAGGAAVAAAVLVLLSRSLADPGRGAAVWGAAGALGAAVGPAAGGLLTEALSWEAIFAVQVPIALACLLAVRPLAGAEPAAARDVAGRGDRPAVPALLALACLGAGLTAALFLLVLLLIAGWRESPVDAALTVSVMPLAALLAGRTTGRLDDRTRAIAGTILVSGGLAALGLLPKAHIAWTFAPQILIGLGLGLALTALTESALLGRRPEALHGGWTIAARHAGVVVALALLTPLFTADLDDQALRTQESVLAAIIDAPIATATKVDLGLELADRLEATDGRVPEVRTAFAPVRAAAAPEERAALDEAQRHVTEQLDRAATSAFERSFLIAAGLTALALLPLLLGGRLRR